MSVVPSKYVFSNPSPVIRIDFSIVFMLPSSLNPPNSALIEPKNESVVPFIKVGLFVAPTEALSPFKVLTPTFFTASFVTTNSPGVNMAGTLSTSPP